MLYFAYGANMNRAGMRRRCPGALALGVAVLEDHEFFIGVEGCASVKRQRGATVHGVLWRITPRDVAALNAYEMLHVGLYDMRHLPVRFGARRVTAMIYLLRRHTAGRAKPGYMEAIVAAAREWRLPDDYIRSLQRRSLSRFSGARAVDVGEIA
jgi:cation transport regulator ChaC